ncbi:hypothetical protein LWM68_43360 [Niabella sp. W65]|nr:hypothetical protein [Niabella sp. W65]MCH7368974.1 hypothetical protein [Niabella sp. W65]ULT44549.1 hypothetical protein KRR40_15100 [Niabella sp. I65]
MGNYPDRAQMLQLADAGFPADIVAFGEAENGTLYAASLSGNTIYKVVDNAALPVTFGSIKAVRKGATLYINWTTTSETNNSHFEIEASIDGKSFTSIKTVNSKAANGNSSSPVDYNVTLGADSLSVVLGLSLLVVWSITGFRTGKNG